MAIKPSAFSLRPWRSRFGHAGRNDRGAEEAVKAGSLRALWESAGLILLVFAAGGPAEHAPGHAALVRRASLEPLGQSPDARAGPSGVAASWVRQRGGKLGGFLWSEFRGGFPEMMLRGSLRAIDARCPF